MFLIVLITILFLSACGHPKQAHVNVPPPPPPASTTETPSPEPSANASPSEKSEAPQPKGEAEADLAEPTLPADAKPLATESGLASWYGPPYHNRRGSNGEVYNMHAMTAAHRTYAAGLDRARHQRQDRTHALVRITDRGPFIPGRVLDFSLAAARKVDVWRPGVAEVKVELMQIRRRSIPENGRYRSADSPTKTQPGNSPTISPAAIAPPRSCASPAPPAIGGCVSASSTTTTTAPRNCRAKPERLKAQSFWSTGLAVTRPTFALPRPQRYPHDGLNHD